MNWNLTKTIKAIELSFKFIIKYLLSIIMRRSLGRKKKNLPYNLRRESNIRTRAKWIKAAFIEREMELFEKRGLRPIKPITDEWALEQARRRVKHGIHMKRWKAQETSYEKRRNKHLAKILGDKLIKRFLAWTKDGKIQLGKSHLSPVFLPRI